MSEPEESTVQPGQDETLNLMIQGRVPLTRQNYLHLSYAGQLPKPWTMEHEQELPEQFQDWDQFKPKQGAG